MDSVHVPSNASRPLSNLRLLTAYESGHVILREYLTPERVKSVEGRGWEAIWNVKLHNEASEKGPCSSISESYMLSHGHAGI